MGHETPKTEPLSADSVRVRRFDLATNGERWLGELAESPDGDWVRFDDHAKERDLYREALDDLKIHGTPVVDGWMSVPICEWEQVFERIGRSALEDLRGPEKQLREALEFIRDHAKTMMKENIVYTADEALRSAQPGIRGMNMENEERKTELRAVLEPKPQVLSTNRVE